MALNPLDLLKVKEAWHVFSANHPKFRPFIHAVAETGVPEGTVIEISFTPPDGKKLETNLKVQESDLELLRIFKGIMGG